MNKEIKPFTMQLHSSPQLMVILFLTLVAVVIRNYKHYLKKYLSSVLIQPYTSILTTFFFLKGVTRLMRNVKLGNNLKKFGNHCT